jgi:succinate dehydrogenase/fumarate reductase flavoprotein subunit
MSNTGKGINRRDFLKGAAVVGGSAALATGLAACSPTAGGGSSTGSSGRQFSGITGDDDYADSIVVLDKITDFADEQTFDLVVVGAGVAGMPAVLTGLEEGASVCCLQKLSTASGNGNASSGLILSESDSIGVLEWMESMRKQNNYRVNWDVMAFHANHSGETLCWLDKVCAEIDYPANLHTIADSKTFDSGTHITYAKHQYRANNLLVQELAKYAESKGATFYYNTPAVQLVQDGSGKVTGVIGQKEDGSYIKVNTNTAVILATGDYQCNDSMKKKYTPDLLWVEPYQIERTGDGHLMAIAIGAQMVPQPHAKQAHDVFSTTFGISATPMLSLDHSGKRFMNEDTTMPMWLNSTRYFYDQEDRGVFFRIFDDAFDTKFTTFPVKEEMEKYIIGQEVAQDATSQIPYEPGMIGCRRADTLDDLAKQLGLDAAAVKASVERWNQFCASGNDEDFGVTAEFLKPIDTPPYWGITNHVRIVAINAGVVVDGEYQVLDQNYKPIPGLFAVGTTGGDITGAADWLMSSAVTNGHCMTSGRYSAIKAITGGLTPTHPVAWEEVSDLYDWTVTDSTWQKK